MTEKNNEVYEIVEVPTQTSMAIKKPNGEIVDLYSGVVEILNELQEIKKAVIG